MLRITSPRLVIRNLAPADLEDFHFYRSNQEVTAYQGFDPFDLATASEFIESQKDKMFGNKNEWVQYGIELLESRKLIGDCAIKLHEDVRIASFGITISHTEQNLGYAKEVMIAIVDFLFHKIGVLRIEEIVDVRNTASIKLLESVGFRREGHFIENVFFKGEWGSEYRYAMLKREWLLIKS